MRYSHSYTDPDTGTQFDVVYDTANDRYDYIEANIERRNGRRVPRQPRARPLTAFTRRDRRDVAKKSKNTRRKRKALTEHPSGRISRKLDNRHTRRRTRAYFAIRTRS